MLNFQWFLLLVSFVMVRSLVETKQLICDTSYDKRKKLCYFSENQGCAQFHSCQETICIADGNSRCIETTFQYNEEECLIEVCSFNPYEGNLQQCISQFRKKQSDFTSTIESIVITGLIIFVMVSIVLEIKHCLCPGNSSPNQQELDQQTQQEWRQRQEMADNGFFQVRSEENIVQMSQGQRQRKRRQMFMKRHHQNESQTDLNLGFIHEQVSPLKEPVKLENEVCCICLNSSLINTQTACGHLYHSKCLLEWLKMKQFCPSCRRTNFTPVKIFCTNCNKIRDIFRINKKNYLGYSRISGEYFSKFDSCNQCIDRIYESKSLSDQNKKQVKQ